MSGFVSEGTLVKLPTVVGVRSGEPRLSVAELSPQDKRVLWQHLKNRYSGVADELRALSADTIVQSLVTELDASFLIPMECVPGELRRKSEQPLRK